MTASVATSGRFPADNRELARPANRTSPRSALRRNTIHCRVVAGMRLGSEQQLAAVWLVVTNSGYIAASRADRRGREHLTGRRQS